MRATKLAFLTGIVAAFMALAAITASAAAPSCAFHDDGLKGPCAAKRSKTFVFYGAMTELDLKEKTVDVDVAGFSDRGRARKALKAFIGDDVEVWLGKRSMRAFVKTKKAKTRVSVDELLKQLDGSEEATLYVKAKLRPKSYWDDDPTKMAASQVVADFSD